MPLQDYDPCEFEPRRLSKEQIAEPQLVIDAFFDYAHLPEIREKLWDWLRLTVTGSFHHEEWKDKVNLLYFYEQICKLVEAAHLIHRKRENEKFEG